MLNDEAVYGVLHRESVWLPDGLDVDIEPDEWMVACADAHPSYDFWLCSDQAFTGSGMRGQTDSFARKLEQDAVIWEMRREGWRIVPRPSERILETTEVAENLVVEASDKFTRVFRSSSLLAFRSHNGRRDFFVASS